MCILWETSRGRAQKNRNLKHKTNSVLIIYNLRRFKQSWSPKYPAPPLPSDTIDNVLWPFNTVYIITPEGAIWTRSPFPSRLWFIPAWLTRNWCTRVVTVHAISCNQQCASGPMCARIAAISIFSIRGSASATDVLQLVLSSWLPSSGIPWNQCCFYTMGLSTKWLS